MDLYSQPEPINPEEIQQRLENDAQMFSEGQEAVNKIVAHELKTIFSEMGKRGLGAAASSARVVIDQTSVAALPGVDPSDEKNGYRPNYKGIWHNIVPTTVKTICKLFDFGVNARSASLVYDTQAIRKFFAEFAIDWVVEYKYKHYDLDNLSKSKSLEHEVSLRETEDGKRGFKLTITQTFVDIWGGSYLSIKESQLKEDILIAINASGSKFALQLAMHENVEERLEKVQSKITEHLASLIEDASSFKIIIDEDSLMALSSQGPKVKGLPRTLSAVFGGHLNYILKELEEAFVKTKLSDSSQIAREADGARIFKQYFDQVKIVAKYADEQNISVSVDAASEPRTAVFTCAKPWAGNMMYINENMIVKSYAAVLQALLPKGSSFKAQCADIEQDLVKSINQKLKSRLESFDNGRYKSQSFNFALEFPIWEDMYLAVDQVAQGDDVTREVLLKVIRRCIKNTIEKTIDGFQRMFEDHQSHMNAEFARWFTMASKFVQQGYTGFVFRFEHEPNVERLNRQFELILSKTRSQTIQVLLRTDVNSYPKKDDGMYWSLADDRTASHLSHFLQYEYDDETAKRMHMLEVEDDTAPLANPRAEPAPIAQDVLERRLKYRALQEYSEIAEEKLQKECVERINQLLIDKCMHGRHAPVKFQIDWNSIANLPGWDPVGDRGKRKSIFKFIMSMGIPYATVSAIASNIFLTGVQYPIFGHLELVEQFFSAYEIDFLVEWRYLYPDPDTLAWRQKVEVTERDLPHVPGKKGFHVVIYQTLFNEGGITHTVNWEFVRQGLLELVDVPTRLPHGFGMMCNRHWFKMVSGFKKSQEKLDEFFAPKQVPITLDIDSVYDVLGLPGLPLRDCGSDGKLVMKMSIQHYYCSFVKYLVDAMTGTVGSGREMSLAKKPENKKQFEDTSDAFIIRIKALLPGEKDHKFEFSRDPLNPRTIIIDISSYFDNYWLPTEEMLISGLGKLLGLTKSGGTAEDRTANIDAILAQKSAEFVAKLKKDHGAPEDRQLSFALEWSLIPQIDESVQDWVLNTFLMRHIDWLIDEFPRAFSSEASKDFIKNVVVTGAAKNGTPGGIKLNRIKFFISSTDDLRIGAKYVPEAGELQLHVSSKLEVGTWHASAEMMYCAMGDLFFSSYRKAGFLVKQGVDQLGLGLDKMGLYDFKKKRWFVATDTGVVYYERSDDNGAGVAKKGEIVLKNVKGVSKGSDDKLLYVEEKRKIELFGADKEDRDAWYDCIYKLKELAQRDIQKKPLPPTMTMTFEVAPAPAPAAEAAPVPAATPAEAAPVPVAESVPVPVAESAPVPQ